MHFIVNFRVGLILYPILLKGEKYVKVLSLDQASKLGYAVFNDKKLIHYNTVDFNDIEMWEDRIYEITKYIEILYKKYKPHLVTIEDIQYQKNQQTYKNLAQLQGMIIGYLKKNEILYEIIPANRWKSYIGLNLREKRKLQKQQTQLFIRNKFNIDVDEDSADAIAMGWYSVNQIKIEKKEYQVL